MPLQILLLQLLWVNGARWEGQFSALCPVSFSEGSLLRVLALELHDYDSDLAEP